VHQTLLVRRQLLTYLRVLTLCLSEGSDTDSSTDDESLLEQQQRQQRTTRRKRRQRLVGVSDELVVAAVPAPYCESVAQAAVESTCTTSEPQPHISPVSQLNSQAIPDHEELEFQGQAIQDVAIDHEELEPQRQVIPGHGAIPGVARSEPVAAGSVIVVHATVERQPPSSPGHS